MALADKRAEGMHRTSQKKLRVHVLLTTKAPNKFIQDTFEGRAISRLSKASGVIRGESVELFIA